MVYVRTDSSRIPVDFILLGRKARLAVYAAGNVTPILNGLLLILLFA